MRASGSEVADLLRNLRQRKGESLRVAARGIGVDPGHLARLEAGEKPPSDALSARVSAYYEVDPDSIHLAAGRIPPDVVTILVCHPEELARLRESYKADG